MPKRVLIIGALFCLAGVVAIWEVIEALFRSNINLNFAVLLLPVGIGLLRGRKRSQWWARFWIILGYVFCAGIALLGIIAPGNAHAKIFNREIYGVDALPYLFAVAVLVAIFLFIIHRLLYSQRAEDFFQN